MNENMVLVTGLADPARIPLVQWILVVVQVVGLLALIAYVWKTWQIAKATRDAAISSSNMIAEMRAARDAATAPQVAIYLSSASSNFAEIVLENFGEGTAAEVNCSFDPPLQSTFQGNAQQFFQVPKWLPPRSRLTHGFDTWAQYLNSSLPRRYMVTVTYKDVTRIKSYSVQYVLDVSAFEHMLKWEQKGLHDLAKTTDDLRGQLGTNLRKAYSREEARDNVRELLPLTTDPDEAVAIIFAAWGLLQAVQAAPNAIAFEAPYLGVMRRSSSGALAGAIRHQRSESGVQALKDLFVALHHHDFQVMTDRTAARNELSNAIDALRASWLFGS